MPSQEQDSKDFNNLCIDTSKTQRLVPSALFTSRISVRSRYPNRNNLRIELEEDLVHTLAVVLAEWLQPFLQVQAVSQATERTKRFRGNMLSAVLKQIYELHKAMFIIVGVGLFIFWVEGVSPSCSANHGSGGGLRSCWILARGSPKKVNFPKVS